MREPILAKLLRFLVYITAFMPLIIFSQFISPFHFGKVVVFRSIVEIMAALYLVLLWQDRSFFRKPDRIFWAFLAFTGAFTVTTMTSIIPYASFWGSLERMGGLWTFWHYFVFFVVVRGTLYRREHWVNFLDITIFVAILSALYGFGQKTDAEFFIGSGGRQRIFGTIGNAALFAGYEIVGLFLALTFFLQPTVVGWRKVLYGAGAVLGTVAVMMTVVRGSILGLGVGFFIFAAMHFIAFRSRKAKLIVLGLSAAAAVFLLVLFTPLKELPIIQSSPSISRLTTTSFEAYTAKTRFWAWRAGFQGWSEDVKTIVLGWGPENFNIPFSKHFDPRFFQGPGSETLFDRAHNMFVEVLTTMGLLGLLAYVGIFWAAFKSLSDTAKRKPEYRLYKLGLISLLVAYMIHNSFIFDTSANFLVFFSVLGFISFILRESSVEAGKPSVRKSFHPINTAQVMLVSLLLIAVTVLIYQTNVKQSLANFATTRGVVAGWNGKFDLAVEKYREATAYEVAGKYELRHRAAQYILEYATNKSAFNQAIVDAIKYALEESQKNAYENQADYLPLLYISRLYITLGKGDPASPLNDEALKYSLRALDLAPKFVRTYYEVAQAYLNKKDYDNAAKYFKQAVDLQSEVSLSWWYWGMTEMQRGNTKEGSDIIKHAVEIGYVLSEADFQRIISGYARANDYVNVVVILEQLAERTGKAQFYAQLATAYGKTNRLDDAVKAAHKAADIDPAFEKEARAFVESIGREW